MPENMTVNTENECYSDLSSEDFLVVGVASCYQSDEGELKPIQVLEPVPSAYLEAICQGVPTSYRCLWGTTLGAIPTVEDVAKITGIQGIKVCQNLIDRAAATARTYKSRPAAKALITIGELRADINHSTEKKRILNAENVVATEDNVRQHEYTHQQL